MGTLTDIIRLTRIIAWINEEFLLFSVFALLVMMNRGMDMIGYFLFLGYLIFFLSFGYGFNSFIDHRKDFSVGKDNMYPLWSKKTTALFLSSLFFCTLILSFFLHPVFGILSLLSAVGYSLLKERGLLSVIIASIAQFLLPFLTFSGLADISTLFLAGWLFFYGLSDILIHQLDDYETDIIAFKGVFAARHGKAKARTLVFFLISVQIVSSIILLIVFPDLLFVTFFMMIFTAGQVKDIVLGMNIKKTKKSIFLDLGDQLGYENSIKRQIGKIRKHSKRIIFSGYEPFVSSGFWYAAKLSKGLEIELMTTARPFADKKNLKKAHALGIRNFLVHLSDIPDARQIRGIRALENHNLSFYIIQKKPDINLIEYMQRFDYKKLHLKNVCGMDKGLLRRYKNIMIKD